MIDPVSAQYSEPLSESEAGNPLILALPAFTRFTISEISDAMSEAPDEDTAPAIVSGNANRSEISMELRKRHRRCFIPLATHIELQRSINEVLRAGYIDRNPVHREDIGNIKNIHVASDGVTVIGKRRKIRRTDPSGLALIGCSGIGKSFAIENILALYDQVIYHEAHGFRQVVYLRVDFPADGKERSLYRAILTELDSILGTNLAEEYENAREGALLTAVVNALDVFHVGILVIDEFQNVLTFGKDSRLREQKFNFMVSLSNMTRVPLVLVGTPAAYQFLHQRLRVARRAGVALEWTRPGPEDPIWIEFTNKLWGWRVLDKDIPTMSQELRDALYDSCQGITDLAVRLFFLSQMHINKIAKPMHLMPDVIFTVFDRHFKTLRPFINELSEGLAVADDWSPKYEAMAGNFEKQAEKENVDEETPSVKDIVKKLRGRLANLGIHPTKEVEQVLEQIVHVNAKSSFDTLFELAKSRLVPTKKAEKQKPAMDKAALQASMAESLGDASVFG